METGAVCLLIAESGGPRRRPSHSFVFVLDVGRQSLQLFQEDERAMGRNLEALAAGLAGHVVVDTDEMVFDFGEHRAGPLVGAAGHLSLLRAAYPADGVLIGPPAAGALQPRRTLLGLLGKELTLVHGI